MSFPLLEFGWADRETGDPDTIYLYLRAYGVVVAGDTMMDCRYLNHVW